MNIELIKNMLEKFETDNILSEVIFSYTDFLDNNFIEEAQIKITEFEEESLMNMKKFEKMRFKDTIQKKLETCLPLHFCNWHLYLNDDEIMLQWFFKQALSIKTLSEADICCVEGNIKKYFEIFLDIKISEVLVFRLAELTANNYDYFIDSSLAKDSILQVLGLKSNLSLK